MPGKWELTVNDPCKNEPAVTTHDTYDDALSHIRSEYDLDGYYADESAGSLQNYLSGEGYRFDFRELAA